MVPCQFLVPKLKSGMEHHGTMDSKRAGFGSWISMNFIWFTTAIHCPMICRLLQPQTSRGSFRNDGPRVAAPFVSPVASLTYYIYTPRSIGYPNMYYCLNSAYGSSIFLWLVNPPFHAPWLRCWCLVMPCRWPGDKRRGLAVNFTAQMSKSCFSWVNFETIFPWEFNIATDGPLTSI